MLIAVAARVIQGAFDRVDLDVDADIGPVPLDQLQRIDRVRIQRGYDVDREKHLLTVRAQPHLLAIALVVAKFVQNVVGLPGVEFGELAREFFVVPRVAGAWTGLIRLGLPKVDDVDDFLAVHAQRQRLAELLVGEHLAHLRVFVGDIQVDLNLLRTGVDEFD